MKDEQALLQRAKKFDEDALVEIYDQYSPGIYRYAMRLLGNVEQAEDCVSETFSRFLTSLKSGGGPEQHLQAYLYRIAHNWVTDCYRREPTPPISLEDQPFMDPAPGPAQLATDELERQEVVNALRLLTPEQQQVIVLKYLEGWSNDDISQVLKKPVGAVKALQFRALQSLKRIFERDIEE